MSEEIDLDYLDYDNVLSADASQFGLVAQGGAIVADTGVVATPPHETFIPKTLQQALVVARETYGETNSEHSEVFCHWVGDVLLGATNVKETKEMLSVLHDDKESFGGRVSVSKTATRLRARRHASICAMNIVRAVLNKLKGLDYEQWVVRSLYRATLAEGDVKGEV